VQDPKTGGEVRHHMDESLAQKSGSDIRIVQELLGHNDVKTTMVYTHVLKRGPAGVCSPADVIRGGHGGFYGDPYKTL